MPPPRRRHQPPLAPTTTPPGRRDQPDADDAADDATTPPRPTTHQLSPQPLYDDVTTTHQLTNHYSPRHHSPRRHDASTTSATSHQRRPRRATDSGRARGAGVGDAEQVDRVDAGHDRVVEADAQRVVGGEHDRGRDVRVLAAEQAQARGEDRVHRLAVVKSITRPNSSSARFCSADTRLGSVESPCRGAGDRRGRERDVGDAVDRGGRELEVGVQVGERPGRDRQHLRRHVEVEGRAVEIELLAVDGQRPAVDVRDLVSTTYGPENCTWMLSSPMPATCVALVIAKVGVEPSEVATWT